VMMSARPCGQMRESMLLRWGAGSLRHLAR
jgi:hypothetical protein